MFFVVYRDRKGVGQMSAKDELWQVRRAKARVRRREDEIAELECILEGCTSKADGLPKGQSGDKLAEQVGRLVSLKECLAAEIETFLDERERALKRINGIKNENMRDVLVYRYIIGLDWKSVAKAMHYDEHHVYKIHGWALQAYEKVCEKDNNATK